MLDKSYGSASGGRSSNTVIRCGGGADENGDVELESNPTFYYSVIID